MILRWFVVLVFIVSFTIGALADSPDYKSNYDKAKQAVKSKSWLRAITLFQSTLKSSYNDSPYDDPYHNFESPESGRADTGPYSPYLGIGYSYYQLYLAGGEPTQVSPDDALKGSVEALRKAAQTGSNHAAYYYLLKALLAQADRWQSQGLDTSSIFTEIEKRFKEKDQISKFSKFRKDYDTGVLGEDGQVYQSPSSPEFAKKMEELAGAFDRPSLGDNSVPFEIAVPSLKGTATIKVYANDPSAYQFTLNFPGCPIFQSTDKPLQIPSDSVRKYWAVTIPINLSSVKDHEARIKIARGLRNRMGLQGNVVVTLSDPKFPQPLQQDVKMVIGAKERDYVDIIPGDQLAFPVGVNEYSTVIPDDQGILSVSWKYSDEAAPHLLSPGDTLKIALGTGHSQVEVTVDSLLMSGLAQTKKYALVSGWGTGLAGVIDTDIKVARVSGSMVATSAVKSVVVDGVAVPVSIAPKGINSVSISFENVIIPLKGNTALLELKDATGQVIGSQQISLQNVPLFAKGAVWQQIADTYRASAQPTKEEISARLVTRASALLNKQLELSRSNLEASNAIAAAVKSLKPGGKEATQIASMQVDYKTAYEKTLSDKLGLQVVIAKALRNGAQVVLVKANTASLNESVSNVTVRYDDGAGYKSEVTSQKADEWIPLVITPGQGTLVASVKVASKAEPFQSKPISIASAPLVSESSLSQKWQSVVAKTDLRAVVRDGSLLDSELKTRYVFVAKKRAVLLLTSAQGGDLVDAQTFIDDLNELSPQDAGPLAQKMASIRDTRNDNEYQVALKQISVVWSNKPEDLKTTGGLVKVAVANLNTDKVEIHLLVDGEEADWKQPLQIMPYKKYEFILQATPKGKDRRQQISNAIAVWSPGVKLQASGKQSPLRALNLGTLTVDAPKPGSSPGYFYSIVRKDDDREIYQSKTPSTDAQMDLSNIPMMEDLKAGDYYVRLWYGDAQVLACSTGSVRVQVELPPPVEIKYAVRHFPGDVDLGDLTVKKIEATIASSGEAKLDSKLYWYISSVTNPTKQPIAVGQTDPSAGISTSPSYEMKYLKMLGAGTYKWRVQLQDGKLLTESDPFRITNKAPVIATLPNTTPPNTTPPNTTKPNTTPPTPNSHYYAICIGIDFYPLQMLSNAARDANNMSTVLTSFGFTSTLISLKAKDQAVATAITPEAFKKQLIKIMQGWDKPIEVVLYYAGHGVSLKQTGLKESQDGFLMPLAQKWDDEKQFLPIKDFIRIAHETLPEECDLVLILDCCRSTMGEAYFAYPPVPPADGKQRNVALLQAVPGGIGSLDEPELSYTENLTKVLREQKIGKIKPLQDKTREQINTTKDKILSGEIKWPQGKVDMLRQMVQNGDFRLPESPKFYVTDPEKVPTLIPPTSPISSLVQPFFMRMDSFASIRFLSSYLSDPVNAILWSHL